MAFIKDVIHVDEIGCYIWVIKENKAQKQYTYKF